jgi:hypothetical protein
MKRFLVWLGTTAFLFFALGLALHLYLTANPRKLAVVVDTSFSMQAQKALVDGELERLARTRYTVFSLLTEKAPIHGWQPLLEAPRALTFYGPRDLSALMDPQRFPELAEADRVVLVTDSPDVSGLRGLRGLQVDLTR